MTRERILVTGAAGQLGGAIVDAFSSDCDVTAATRSDLDTTDDRAIAAAVARIVPSVIINCAAYNQVDAAEQAPADALSVNAFAVRALARAAAPVGAVLVHYSTDFVFDGETSRPYTEDDRPNPKSAYAGSKLLGEWFARDAPRHYVLRVESLFGGRQRTSSVDRIVDAILERREARVFIDRTLSPSYSLDVAWATHEAIVRKIPFGLYHCVNAGTVTWAGLAEEAARQLGLEPQLVRVRAGDVSLPAQRPVYSALSTARLAAAGIVMPSWADALGRYLQVRVSGESEHPVHQASHGTPDREARGQSR